MRKGEGLIFPGLWWLRVAVLLFPSGQGRQGRCSMCVRACGGQVTGDCCAGWVAPPRLWLAVCSWQAWHEYCRPVSPLRGGKKTGTFLVFDGHIYYLFN